MSVDCQLQEIQVLFLDEQVKAHLLKLKTLHVTNLFLTKKVLGSSRYLSFPKKKYLGVQRSKHAQKHLSAEWFCLWSTEKIHLFSDH